MSNFQVELQDPKLILNSHLQFQRQLAFQKTIINSLFIAQEHSYGRFRKQSKI